ncbi:DUF5801 repeats-in-toxin domain-containing protein, partial [Mesorhizobium sp. ZC-5]|uniref:DUF5801 repeats-in-toxin domain-containing protein n=1 Tax=Mesorhizobium sp. ZC-5 TaxID=2986066 RepID=UPI002981359C
LTLSAAAAIRVVQTVTDGDGDTDTATSVNGLAISFEDDGPSVSLTPVAGATLVVDETLGEVTGNETEPAGTLGSRTVAASALFTTTAAGGSDGLALTTYTLSIPADGTASGLFYSVTDEPIVLVDNGGVIEGHVGAIGGALAFTISVAGNGDITLTQFLAVDHPTGGASHDELSDFLDVGVVTLTVAVTDNDGDTDSADFDLGGVIAFEDDGPIQVGAPLIGEVQEDALDNFDPLYPVGDDIEGSKGNRESNQTQLLVATFTFAMLSALVNAGADGLADIKLNLAGIDGTTVLTAGNAAVISKGEAVVYNVNGGVIEGVSSVDGRIVFRITIDGNGDVSFTLIDQVDHLPLNAAGGDAEVIDIDISGAIVVVDGDGDELVLQDTVTVRVENDIPIAFIPEHAYVVNVDGSALTFQLNFDEAVGADESGNVKFVNVVSGVTELTDASGNPVTSGGKDITLELDASGTVLTGYIDHGLPTETLVLTVSINANDTYTINLDVPLDDGFSETMFNPFDDGQSPGNRLFNEVNDLAIDGSPVLLDVLLSGTDDNGALDSVNVSSGGTGVGSQGITEDVTLRLDFAEEFVRSDIGSSTGSFTVNNTHLLESVAVGIAQTNPNGQQAVAFLEALTTSFSFSGGQFNHNQAADVANFLTETSVAITAIVLNGTEYDVASFANGANLDASHQVYYVMNGANVIGAYVTGLVSGDTVGLTTSDGFSRFAITNGENDPRPGGGGDFVGGSFANSFDVGDVTFRTEGQAGEPIDLSLDVQGTDFDGDTVTSTIDFTVVPNDANNIVGTSNADLALTGTTGDDLIAGLAGNDTLSGNDGDDILAGGLGSDTMTGGAGADTFVVGIDSLGVGINDLILDYNDAQGDVVDLSALLESLSGAPTTAAEVDAVVNLVAGVGTTSIMVDDNGTAAGGNVTEVATLSGTHTVVAILFDDAQAPTDVA